MYGVILEPNCRGARSGGAKTERFSVMSRTYRRRGQRHDYDWVLRDFCWVNGVLVPFWIDPRSKEGRRAIARFHSDACWTLKSTAPHAGTGASSIIVCAR
jgi:hypothetical protein